MEMNFIENDADVDDNNNKRQQYINLLLYNHARIKI